MENSPETRDGLGIRCRYHYRDDPRAPGRRTRPLLPPGRDRGGLLRVALRSLVDPTWEDLRFPSKDILRAGLLRLASAVAS